MILKHLSILNYKNIAQADLNFSQKINCFVGSNGEGKTNVLDAIYFLSFTHSATSAGSDSPCIRHGEELLMLAGEYDVNGTPENITCGLKMHQKKIIRRNQKPYKRIAEHIGLLPLILVSPNDQELVNGGSEERRRYMDIVISQFNPTYMAQLMRYNKALQQRNALLKQLSETFPAPAQEAQLALLEAYEQMMAQSGEYIYNERAKFIDELIPVFQRHYDRISDGHETVSLTYSSHAQRGPLLEIIQRDRQRDIAVGHSLHGIHKDDLTMLLNDFPLRKEGSQGQNKTYLISLKLAQFEFLSQTGSRTKPLLLLDDIFDKLDAQRVTKLIQLVADDSFGQIFITDTNREHLDRIIAQAPGDHRIFSVKAGRVEVKM